MTATAEQRRNDAIARVEAHASQEWKDVAYRAVKWVAQRQPLLTSDDVWEALAAHYPEVQTHEPRAMGAVLRAAVRDGLIRLQTCQSCGTAKVMVPSTRPEAHCSDTAVYRSLIHAGAAS